MKTQQATGSKIKPYLLAGGGIVAVLLVLGGIKFLQINAMIQAGAAMVMPPTTVTAAEVVSDSWRPSIPSVGSVAPVQGVDLSFESSGVVSSVEFENGIPVTKGQRLASLNIASEEAQLKQAEAQASLAMVNHERATKLRREKTISQSEYDSADAERRKALASVEQIRAEIAKKTLVAPFAGRAGIRKINIGQRMEAGTPVVSLHMSDPVFVDFSLPQKQVSLLAVGMDIAITVDAYPSTEFNGKLTALDPDVDPAKRSVSLQATLANPEGKLMPGMFVQVSVQMPEAKSVLTIPATAVLYAPYGNSVFVVDEKKDEKTGQTQKVARQQFVRLGMMRGDFVEVINGLKAGETVVTSGAFKLRPGAPVAVDNKLAPNASLTPTPPNT